MNKGKLTTALYKQLDWFKNEGSEEEKKSAERMSSQFKEGLGIDGCIHDFWIKAMAEKQASLKELKVDAEVRGLKSPVDRNRATTIDVVNEEIVT
nr:3703_t:CDS:2 [Entrophospora candida]